MRNHLYDRPLPSSHSLLRYYLKRLQHGFTSPCLLILFTFYRSILTKHSISPSEKKNVQNMLLIYQFIINADYLKDPNVENAENQVYIKKRIK